MSNAVDKALNTKEQNCLKGARAEVTEYSKVSFGHNKQVQKYHTSLKLQSLRHLFQGPKGLASGISRTVASL